MGARFTTSDGISWHLLTFSLGRKNNSIEPLGRSDYDLVVNTRCPGAADYVGEKRDPSIGGKVGTILDFVQPVRL